MCIFLFLFAFVFLFFFLFSHKISVQSFVFVILCISINYLFYFFLYEKRPVSLRRSCLNSTRNVFFLYESLSACFQYFTSPFPLPASSFLFCQNFSRFILNFSFSLFPFLSFFVFFLSRAHSYARLYIIMCLLFPLLFLPSVFMFYNTFAYQRITKKFPIYSKIIPDIFCLYCKKVYFCIRLARGAKPFLSLTY